MTILRPTLAGLASIVAILTLLGGSALVAQQAVTPAPDSSQADEVVYKAGDGVTAPKVLFRPDPAYTDAAAKKRIEGQVVLKLVVTAEGKARDVKVVKGLDEGLDREAVTSVSKWQFEPATKDGKPVAVEISVEVEFHVYHRGKN